MTLYNIRPSKLACCPWPRGPIRWNFVPHPESASSCAYWQGVEVGAVFSGVACLFGLFVPNVTDPSYGMLCLCPVNMLRSCQHAFPHLWALASQGMQECWPTHIILAACNLGNNVPGQADCRLCPNTPLVTGNNWCCWTLENYWCSVFHNRELIVNAS